MNKIKNFIITSLIGGLIVILPIAILIAVFSWIFNLGMKFIRPFSRILVAHSGYREIVAEILVLGIMLGVCFIIGIVVKTRLGKYLYRFIEKRLLSVAPGYNLIRDTILQILGSNKSPFSSVALAQIFGNETLVTCFVTDESNQGIYSVFIPTGPNPTSGNIYHLEAKYVHLVDVPIEEAMRSIISCGAGSKNLIEAYHKNLSSISKCNIKL